MKIPSVMISPRSCRKLFLRSNIFKGSLAYFFSWLVVGTLARAQNTYNYDAYSTNGGMQMTPYSYYDESSNYVTITPQTAVDSFFVNGYQVDYLGNILPGNWTPVPLNNGDDAVLNTLTLNSNATLLGNLTVGGRLDLNNVTNLQWGGVTAHYQDNGNHDSSNITLSSNTALARWLWQGNGSTQMELSEHGNLTLTDYASGNTIAINPGNSTLMATWNGGSVTIPLDSAVFNATVHPDFNSSGYLGISGFWMYSYSNSTYGYASLSMGSALIHSYSYAYDQALNFGNGAYLNSVHMLPSGGGLAAGVSFSYSSSYGGKTVIGTYQNNLALGANATTLGQNSTAIGNGAVAGGNNTTAAVAFSGGTATGNYSLAFGRNSVASGVGSSAFIGGNATAGGDIAIGEGTVSRSYGTVVLGHYNLPINGYYSDYQASNSTFGGPAYADPAFIVGIGNNTTPANGMVIYNNQNTTLYGPTLLANPNYVSPTDETQPQELQINGASTFNGTVTFGGNVTAPRQGDISMGQFQN